MIQRRFRYLLFPLLNRAVILLLITALVAPAWPAMATPAAPVVPLQAQLLHMAVAEPATLVDIIVQKAGRTTGVEEQVISLGGTVIRDLSLINAFSARLPAGKLPRLAEATGVQWISLNAPVVKASGQGAGDHIVARDDFVASPDGGWGSWTEIGESDGSQLGDVAIASFLGGANQGLRIQGPDRGIQRSLSEAPGIEPVALSFAYRRKDFAQATDYVALQVSPDGGANWTELARLAGPATDADLQSAAFDLTPYASSQTHIRFVSAGSLDARAKFYVDHVQVEYTLLAGEWPYAGQLPYQVRLPLIMGGSAHPAPAQRLSAARAAGPVVRDEFNAIAYTGSDGALAWGGDWQELIERDGPGSGKVQVKLDPGCPSGSCLSLGAGTNLKNGYGLTRFVDLQGATAANLTFDYRRSLFFGWGLKMKVDVRGGGQDWITLATYGTGNDPSVGFSGKLAIPANRLAADTQIRFVLIDDVSYSPGRILVDNVQIERVDDACDGCTAAADLASNFVRATGADQIWQDASHRQGQGVTVAVVDSGIAPHEDLLDAAGQSRILVHVQFSSVAGLPDDFYGHGTHVAGTIAGNGARSGGAYAGMAPQANLIDVKVTNDQGMGSTADVIAGLQWIYENKDVYNIRVVNLSLNSTVAEPYHASPLNAALEILWFNGIVVVVSAGNNGASNSRTLYPPANDPFVITVGAMHDRGTPGRSDDLLAAYSAFGVTESGFAKPDLVAPGSNIISLLASDDSNLVQAHPLHKLPGWAGTAYFRMSGTSMASAVAAGAVALLLQDEPDLTPDQVKHRLMTTAQPFVNPATGRYDLRYLDIAAAVQADSTDSANTGIVASQLLWTGSDPVTWGSVNWNSVNWNSVNWNSVNWNSVNWNSVNWNSVHWDD